MSDPVVLAIESSCDETAAAVQHGRSRTLASVISSQIEIHRRFGGVVPEVASRNHLLALRQVVDAALSQSAMTMSDLDAVAATRGPGLASSLLVGMSCAKGLAIGLGLPFYGVNHLEGHLLSPFLGHPDGVQPCVALLVSGGHTSLVELVGPRQFKILGQTRDDAAGEAFDKVAKMLNLPYPGGPEIEKLAGGGDPYRFQFPRAFFDDDNWEFSFSGLKTAVRYLLPKIKHDDIADVCASFQQAVFDVLIRKTIRAANKLGYQLVSASGGVSINKRFREALQSAAGDANCDLILADPALCTDNAAMIANVAVERLLAGEPSDIDHDVNPNLSLAAG